MQKLAVLGYGNIGSGVVEVLLNNKELIAQKAGEEIVPVCALDLRDFPGDVMEDRIVRDIRAITEDPEISLVVETMGGTEFAYPYVKACLEAGKHVATSNKALVAAHGEELLRIAAEKKVNFLFEASAGGAIPIIRALTGSIVSDQVAEIYGILNGTTNYILSRMEGFMSCDYPAALKEAKALGYAEQDPTADVEGFDSCRKLAILASLAFGRFISFEDIKTEGITKITPEDMQYAAQMGGKIKLLAFCEKTVHGTVKAEVGPVIVRKGHPLYAVDGVMNAVLVRGEMMGELMFYGPGAGRLPTATAVVDDVVTAVRRGASPEIPPFPEGHQAVSDFSEKVGSFLIRARKEAAENLLKLIGKASLQTGRDGEFAVLTKKISAEEADALAREFGAISYFRVEEE